MKKGLFYYKCNTVGCGVNKSAKSLNGTFAAILDRLRIDGSTEVTGLIKTQMKATFNQLNSGREDEYRELENKHQQMVRKIERLEERFMEEEVTADLYNRYLDRYTAERREIEKGMEQSGRVSNLEKCVETAVQFAAELPLRWQKADYCTKQRIQFLLFPEGIRFSKKTDTCRTTRINSVFALLALLAQDLAQQKSGIPELNLDYAALVARRGIEPTS
ncbi:MAG: hypothetical protein ABIN91_19145 [Mucilaginibacter sp.]|uniref:hypothetical protein n=1 Tax=Mucilaginibacter sp. TaxID=1882438 RepID=UPI0032661428